MKSLYLFLGLYIFCLQGCASQRRAELLENRARAYVLSLKRMDEQNLVALVHPKFRADFMKEWQKLRGLELSLVDMQGIDSQADSNEALMAVELEYYSPGQAELNHLFQIINWKYEPTASNWYVDSANPFGKSR